jgi:DNA polymerase-1
MIYILTNNPDFAKNPIYRFCGMDALITYLNSVQEVSTDAETKGFDPHTKALIALQLGDYDNQYIIDCATVDIRPLKAILESKLLILQNGKFDLKFLYKQGIYPRKIYDTFVAERTIYCGLDMMRAALDVLCERYCGVHLDKSVRVDIPKEGLTPRVIAYAADDIKYLPEIKRKQLAEARKKELVAVINLENRFTPCLAYIEYCGFKLDADKWKKKMEGDLTEMQKLEAQLNEWVMTQDMQPYIKQQLEFFQEQSCTINWASPLQVAEFFEDLGLDCTIQEKGVKKKSVEAPVIQKYAAEHEIVRIYLEYKKAQKVVTTYGDSFIQQINEVTGRVHTNFKQILDTGRISSGGKDRDRKVNLINFQNIPADPETRSCFVADEGNTLIICDYTGQEQVILANYSMDPGLLKFYDEGLGDMHSYVASLMYPELNGLSLEEIKTKHKDKRFNAKTAGFSINYGGVGATIAASQNISKEEGDKIYNSYFAAFPGLKAYFDEVRQQGLRDGYVLISPITKRKSYLPFYDRYKELEAVMTKSFWTKYREMKKEADAMYKEGLRPYPEFTEARKQVKDYFYYKGEIERKSLNFPIQGSSASITKMSCIYIYDYILDNNLFDIVKFVNTIHDENVLECPVSMADKIAEVVGNAMVKSGKFFCKRVPLLAVPEKSAYWKK